MSAVSQGRKRAAGRKGRQESAPRHAESAAQWSERIGRLCDQINNEPVPLTPKGEDDLKAAMLASMKAMRLHIDRICREKRILALHAASSICPEGKEGCPLASLRPPSDCASCWEIYAAKKIRGE